LVQVAVVTDDIQSVGPDGACRTQDSERFHSIGTKTSRNCNGITQCPNNDS
jgi:hypothetical protein